MRLGVVFNKRVEVYDRRSDLPCYLELKRIDVFAYNADRNAEGIIFKNLGRGGYHYLDVGILLLIAVYESEIISLINRRCSVPLLRIVLDFNVLYYLIPGYLISLTLSFFVPGLYTAIAFDSGGVASGPLTSSFILPFAVGVCYSMQGADKILVDAFGIVAMVAMAPLITIQLLGFKSVLEAQIQKRIAMARILAADDEQIIDFM